MRRIGAWLLLVLFIFLLVNISFFQLFLVESVMLYVTAVVAFFLGGGMRKSMYHAHSQLADDDSGVLNDEPETDAIEESEVTDEEEK